VKRDLFESAHPAIRDKLYQGLALKAQNMDSGILHQILIHFAKKGVTALPMHDSIIVAEQHEEELEDLMIRHYESANNFTPVITKEY
jgi:hypothetical protein